MSHWLEEEDYSGHLDWRVWGKVLRRVLGYKRYVVPLALTALAVAWIDAAFPLVTRDALNLIERDGAAADLRALGGGQFFLIAGFLTITIHLIFVLISAKALRMDVSMAAVSSVAAVGGAASAPVAAGYHREELVPISIMLALIGYAIGNYLGVATAYLCNLVG